MPKKIVIVVGTRPNFIKITQFEKAFLAHGDYFEYKLVHTGQHFDENMSKVFFEQFRLKKPDLYLNVKGLTPPHQIGKIITDLSSFFTEYRPDLVIVVGDVNSTLAAAIAANKCNIRLAHLESGLRSKDRGMPEEINRILADAITNDFFVTEQSGLENLEKEITRSANIFFVGNTMIDTLVAFDNEIQQSDILERLNISGKPYALMTMHRPRNVDTKDKLIKLLEVIKSITDDYHLVFPIHPRTRKSLEQHSLYDALTNNSSVIITPPLDYLSFQKLIASSAFVITDSGGIQEETTYRQIPCFTLRENTERPITITMGSNELIPFDVAIIRQKIEGLKNGSHKKGQIPPLWDGQATQRIVQHLRDAI